MQTIIRGTLAFWYPGSSGLLPKADPDKPTLLMVHGAANDHSVWTLHARYFAHHGFNVIAVDLPGHGLSLGPTLSSVPDMARWLLDLLNSLSITDFVVLGHSMGSLIALELASLTTNHLIGSPQVKGLGLLGTAIPMTVSDNLLSLIRTDPKKAINQINYWSFSTINSHPGNPGPGFSTYNQNARLMERQGSATLLNDFLACNDYAMGTETLKLVREKTLPVAILTGQQDQMTPSKCGVEIKNQLGLQATYYPIPNCGHALMAQQPHLVLTALKTWLNEIRRSVTPSQLS
jgi:pimeloyl-ACP methyl ester carboxylesterase